MLDKLEASDFSPWLNQTMPIRFNPDVVLPAEPGQMPGVDSYSPAQRKPFSVVLRTEQKNSTIPKAYSSWNILKKVNWSFFWYRWGSMGKGSIRGSVCLRLQRATFSRSLR